jgi:alpha-L-fucosidase
LAALLLARPLGAQGYQPTPENLAARRWFQDAKLGMFIHWGMVEQLEDDMWPMNDKSIRAADYDRLPATWNPVAFDARAWVTAAKQAGMKYITLVSKHHDGFALFDSKLSDFDVVDRTPYGRDIVRQVAEACREQGIKLFFYYSQLDWHHLDYYPRGDTGKETGRPDSGDFNRYLDFMDGQLTELLTNYGPIGGIWFDGMWDKPQAEWRLAQTYGLIHRLQPAALVGSNHHKLPFPGEDFQMFEKDLPGANSAGFNTSEIGTLPLETAQTMNDSWGYRIQDRNWKTPRTMVKEMVEAAGRNANYLLNVGPLPNGTFPPQAVAILAEFGRWTAIYGESVSGTRGGPVTPRPWGVTTSKGDQVYVHLLNGTDRVLGLPPLPRPLRRAYRLEDKAPAVVTRTPQGIALSLPNRIGDPVDEVYVLEFEAAKR